MRQRGFLIRLPAALTVLAFLLVQTGCSGLLPRQTDAADEAILRVAKPANPLSRRRPWRDRGKIMRRRGGI